jgi:hypothetical protein
MSANSESEVLAQQLAVETRLAEVEKVIQGLEAAALTTARAMEEISFHWDQVYKAMGRVE